MCKNPKPCIQCPFRRGNSWGMGSDDKIRAIKELDEQKLVTGKIDFSCHMKHPHSNIFSFQRMKDNDCAGFKHMLENMHTPGTYPDVVNNISETGPEALNLYEWAKRTPTYTHRSNLLIQNLGGISIINIKKQKGVPYDMYIGRQNDYLGLNGSKWQNPFHLKAERDRERILQQHWDYMLTRPDLLAALPELEGKTLACYCCDFQNQGFHGKLCHGMNLIKLYDKFVGIKVVV